jgi:hypothetical protein
MSEIVIREVAHSNLIAASQQKLECRASLSSRSYPGQRLDTKLVFAGNPERLAAGSQDP